MSDYNFKLEKAFDRWSDTYEQEAIKKIELRGYSYELLGKIISDSINKKVTNNLTISIMELGVGTGILGKFVSKSIRKDFYIDGLDISPKMLSIARNKNIYRNLVQSSSDKFKFCEKSYNFIYSAFMFHSVENQRKLLQVLNKSLIKGGLLILIDLVPKIKLEKSVLQSHSIKHEYGAPSNYKTNNEMLELIIESEFQFIELKKLGIDKDFNHYMYVLEKC